MHRDCEFVVAVAENDVIGCDNRLPWRLSADLRHFKALTLGKPVLMGRKTYESIGKALPGRTNLILSRSLDFTAADCIVVHSVQEAQAHSQGDARSRAELEAQPPLMVIGGAEIYRQCLPAARRIHLTLVHATPHGDARFGAWRGNEWRESARERHAADERNDFDYSFITLERA